VFAAVEDEHDVRVREPPGVEGLVFEPLARVGLRREIGAQELDGDVATDPPYPISAFRIDADGM
jgi:hypothetical protein